METKLVELTYNFTTEDNVFSSNDEDTTWNITKLVTNMDSFNGSMKYQIG